MIDSVVISPFIFIPRLDLYAARCYHGFVDCHCGWMPAICRSRAKNGPVQYRLDCPGRNTEDGQFKPHRDATAWCSSMDDAIALWNILPMLQEGRLPFTPASPHPAWSVGPPWGFHGDEDYSDVSEP